MPFAFLPLLLVLPLPLFLLLLLLVDQTLPATLELGLALVEVLPTLVLERLLVVGSHGGGGGGHRGRANDWDVAGSALAHGWRDEVRGENLGQRLALKEQVEQLLNKGKKYFR